MTYRVILSDESENVNIRYVDESFDTLDEAQKRFDKLKITFDFGDHDELWLLEVGEGGAEYLIDVYPDEDR